MSELLIALMILSVLSVLLVGVIPATVNGMKGASQRAYAAAMAREAMEQAVRDGFDRLQNRALPKIYANGTEFEGYLTVSDAVASDGTAMSASLARQVEVTVRWRFRTVDKSFVTRRVIVKQI